jgi:hypothetical protein
MAEDIPMTSYRIISQADASFAVEATDPHRNRFLAASFGTEAECRGYIDRQIAITSEALPPMGADD